MQKRTLEQTVSELTAIYGDEYRYGNLIRNVVPSKLKIEVYCGKHGWSLEYFSNFKLGGGCQECHSVGRHLMSKDEYIKICDLVHPVDNYDYLDSEYSGMNNNITIRCNIHNLYFTQIASRHSHGSTGCKLCALEKLPQNKPLSQIEYINECKKFFDDRIDYILVKYERSCDKILLRCIKHDHLFNVNANAHKNKHVGCPVCKASKGEITIFNFLKKNNIKFETEQSFDSCKNINLLPFDFAIFYNNILVGLVEYQGIQHFTKQAFGSKNKKSLDDKLKTIQLCDSIKKEYCEKNDIPLLEIPYTEFKNIDKILEAWLKELGVL